MYLVNFAYNLVFKVNILTIEGEKVYLALLQNLSSGMSSEGEKKESRTIEEIEAVKEEETG